MLHTLQLLESLRKGSAIAVCDGSYKEGKGASAWAIVDDSKGGSISGCNRVNGNVGCQSSYQSELAGLLSVIMILNELWVFYGLTQAEVTVACDGESALNMALDMEQQIRTQMMDHDLLFVIRAAVTRF